MDISDIILSIREYYLAGTSKRCNKSHSGSATGAWKLELSAAFMVKKQS